MNDKTRSNNNRALVNRRGLLKSTVFASGAVSVATLPSAWIKPVVDSVVLPAHAQTSAPMVGVYSGEAAMVLNQSYDIHDKQFALLDAFFPPVQAQEDKGILIEERLCPTYRPITITIYARINEDLSVDLVLSAGCNFLATSRLIGNIIEDTDIGSIIKLYSLRASGGQVTGRFFLVPCDSFGEFSVPFGGTFPTNFACTD